MSDTWRESPTSEAGHIQGNHLRNQRRDTLHPELVDDLLQHSAAFPDADWNTLQADRDFHFHRHARLDAKEVDMEEPGLVGIGLNLADQGLDRLGLTLDLEIQNRVFHRDPLEKVFGLLEVQGQPSGLHVLSVQDGGNPPLGPELPSRFLPCVGPGLGLQYLSSWSFLFSHDPVEAPLPTVHRAGSISGLK